MTQSINQGSEELLEIVTGVLSRVDVGGYMIIGGWCPVLRNTSSIKHPGTLDVDILFEQGHIASQLEPLFMEFKKLGFGASAKHKFQLLREFDVKGNSIFFNVDILHPLMTENVESMFQDHLELDVPIDEDERKLKSVGSIVQPNSKVLFEESMFSKFEFQGSEFSLVDFEGMYLTKIDSCQKAKRERDSLDILIAVESEGINFSHIADIRSRNPRIEKSCIQFEEFLREKPHIFDGNIKHFADLDYSAADKILKLIS